MDDIVLKQLERREEELKKYENKLAQMVRDWTESKGGSRYGDEYLETQIKVYQAMVAEVKKEIMGLKKNRSKR